jgi:hypothetical protein
MSIKYWKLKSSCKEYSSVEWYTCIEDTCDELWSCNKIDIYVYKNLC